MNRHIALLSLINAFTLLIGGLWAYFGSLTPSPTALIPSGIGLVLIALYAGVRRQNMVAIAGSFGATMIVTIPMLLILRGLILRGEVIPIMRAGMMCTSCIIALVGLMLYYLKQKKAMLKTSLLNSSRSTYLRSKRSRFITLVHALAKSLTNFSSASALA